MTTKLGKTEKDSELLFSLDSIPTSHKHVIRLSGSIEDDAILYEPVIKTLENAEENDFVEIHLNNYGGSCQTGVVLAYAVKSCRAPVQCIVSSRCYSMGAILALCGSGITMMRGSYLMFHNYSSYRSGKGGELTMSVEEFNKHFKSILDELCRPFLTKKEITRLIDDKDIYIHADDKDTLQRFERHYK